MLLKPCEFLAKKRPYKYVHDCSVLWLLLTMVCTKLWPKKNALFKKSIRTLCHSQVLIKEQKKV